MDWTVFWKVAVQLNKLEKTNISLNVLLLIELDAEGE